MTDAEINEREIDARIAVAVFGWEWLERDNPEGGHVARRKCLYPPTGGAWRRFNFSPTEWVPAKDSTELFSDWDECCATIDGTQCGLPHYSTDISAAMEVVEKLRERGLCFGLNQGSPYKSKALEAIQWRATFSQLKGVSDPWCWDANAETAARAICLAALETTK